MGEGSACGGERPEDLAQHGYKWQCVEFVRRFHATNTGPNVWNLNNSWPTPFLRDANGVVRKGAYVYFDRASALGLEAIPNGDDRRPQVDDILVFGRAERILDTFGHIAIVSSVTDTSVTVVEQNSSHTGYKVLARDTGRSGYWLRDRGSYPIRGWLRRPAPSTPPSIFSTYLGGPGGSFIDDTPGAMTVDAQGATYVAGIPGPAFPIINAIQPSPADARDGFLTKFDAQGRVVYSTYLRPSIGFPVLAADASGNVFIAGPGGGLLSLDPTGSQVRFFTEHRHSLAGFQNAPTIPNHVKLDADGNVIVVGRAVVFGGQFDYIAKFSPSGSLMWERSLSSLVSAIDACLSCTTVDIDVDAAGNVYGIARLTDLVPFLPMNPLPGVQTGNGDVLVFRLDPNGQALNTTVLGGTGEDRGVGISVSADGEMTILGFTDSNDFPTTPNAYLRGRDVVCANRFLTKLRFSAVGANLLASTYLECSVAPIAVVRRANGDVWVSGPVNLVFGSDVGPVPTQGAVFDTGFLWAGRLDPELRGYVFASRFGGTMEPSPLAGNDQILDIGVAAADQSVSIVGYTARSDFQTSPNPQIQFPSFQPALAGLRDTVVLKLRSNPEPPVLE